MTCKCDCDREIEVTIENHPIVVTVEKQPRDPIVTIEVPGLRGPSTVDVPFDEDPTEIYLNARGKINGNN